MPTVDEIREAIATTIRTVPNTGEVHTFERYAKEQAAFRQFYLSGSGADARVEGWNIRRIRTVRKGPLGVRTVWHTWRISGFRSIADGAESELEFDRLIEAIEAAFNADETLGGAVGGTTAEDGETTGIQVEDAGPVMFAGVLCHSARLILFTMHVE